MTRVVAVEPLPHCRLKVTFNDGLSGVFAVEPEKRGGVFLKLQDQQVFDCVTISPEFGCVEWPGGIDICPDVMHEAVAGSVSRDQNFSAMALREQTKGKH